jgi:hypothetical protein
VPGWSPAAQVELDETRLVPLTQPEKAHVGAAFVTADTPLEGGVVEMVAPRLVALCSADVMPDVVQLVGLAKAYIAPAWAAAFTCISV